MKKLPLAKPRACGTCTVCCTVLSVPEIPKAVHTACEHLGSHKGCAIYKDRPKSCADFHCLWLTETEGVDGEYRPDRCGLVLTTIQPKTWLTTAVVAHEVWPGAGSAGPGKALVDDLSRTILVMVRTADLKGYMKGPKGQVALYEKYIDEIKNK